MALITTTAAAFRLATDTVEQAEGVEVVSGSSRPYQADRFLSLFHIDLCSYRSGERVDWIATVHASGKVEFVRRVVGIWHI